MSWEMIIPGIILISLVVLMQKAKKKKQPPPKKPIIILFSALAAYGLILMMISGTIPVQKLFAKNEADKKIIFFEAAGYGLGNYLAGKCLGTDILIIASPEYKNNPEEGAMIKGLLKGLSMINKENVIDKLEFGEKEDPAKPAAKNFNEVIKKYEGVDIVVSTIGLPPDAENLILFNKKTMKEIKKPAKVVVLGGEGFTFLKNEFKDGMLEAAVFKIPDKTISDDTEIPKDIMKAFEDQYILLTWKNYKDVSTQYKDAFTKK